MKSLFSAILALLFCFSAGGQATQGTSVRATNGVTFGTLTVGGRFAATNSAVTNTIAGKLNIGNQPTDNSRSLTVGSGIHAYTDPFGVSLSGDGSFFTDSSISFGTVLEMDGAWAMNGSLGNFLIRDATDNPMTNWMFGDYATNLQFSILWNSYPPELRLGTLSNTIPANLGASGTLYGKGVMAGTNSVMGQFLTSSNPTDGMFYAWAQPSLGAPSAELLLGASLSTANTTYHFVNAAGYSNASYVQVEGTSTTGLNSVGRIRTGGSDTAISTGGAGTTNVELVLQAKRQAGSAIATLVRLHPTPTNAAQTPFSFDTFITRSGGTLFGLSNNAAHRFSISDAGDLQFVGTGTGNGSGFTSLNGANLQSSSVTFDKIVSVMASNITSGGPLPVAALGGLSPVFNSVTGTNLAIYGDAVVQTLSHLPGGGFIGDGGSLTNVQTTNIVGVNFSISAIGALVCDAVNVSEGAALIRDDGTVQFSDAVVGDLAIGGVATGDGSGLTNIYATNILSGGQLPLGTVSTGLSAVAGPFLTTNGAARSYSYNASALTNLNASSVASGTLADARLSANVPLLNIPDVFTAGVAATNFSVINATVTSNSPFLTVTQTWNNSAITFEGVVVDITNTSSASTSRPLSIRSSGANRLDYRFSGGNGGGLLTVNGDVNASGDVYNGGGTLGFNFGTDSSICRYTWGPGAGGSAINFRNVSSSRTNMMLVLNGGQLSPVAGVGTNWPAILQVGSTSNPSLYFVNSSNTAFIPVVAGNIGATNVTGTNFLNGQNDIRTNISAFDVSTTDFVLGTRYTNSNRRAWVAASLSLTAAVAGTATVSLYVEHGTTITNKLTVSAGPLASLVVTEQLCLPVPPKGFYYFADEDSGSGATSAVVSGTCSVTGL